MKPLRVILTLLILSSIALGQSSSGGGPTGGAFISASPPGTGYQDVTEIAAPANPAAGVDRIYSDIVAHTIKCLTSGGGSCLASGGGVSSGTNGFPYFNNNGATGNGTIKTCMDPSFQAGATAFDKVDAALLLFNCVDARNVTAANGFTMTGASGINFLRNCGGNTTSHLILSLDTWLTDVTVQQPKACIVEGAGRALVTTIIRPAAALHTIAETNTKFALASGKLTWVTGSPGTVTMTFPASTTFLFNANASTATTTVSGLGAATKSLVKTVTDGNSATDCTVGGGATSVLCIGTGSVWTFAPNVPDGMAMQVGCATATVGGRAPDAAFNGIWRAFSAAGSGTATPTVTYRAGNAAATLPASSTGVCTVIFLATPLWLEGDYFQANNYQGIRLEHLNLDADVGTTHFGLIPLVGINPQERSLVNDLSIINWNGLGIAGYGNDQNWGPIQNIESYMINSNANGNCNPTGANLDGNNGGGASSTVVRAGILPSEHVYLVDNAPKGIFFMTGTNGLGFSGANCQGSVGGGATVPTALVAGFDVSVPAATLLLSDHTELSDIGIELGKQYSGSANASFATTIIDFTGSPAADSDTTAVDISPLWALNSDFSFQTIRKNQGMTNTINNGITGHAFTDANIAKYDYDKNGTQVHECGSYTQFPCRMDGGLQAPSLVLTGVTSGSTTLSASATGGTLNLGSNASVTAAGAMSLGSGPPSCGTGVTGAFCLGEAATAFTTAVGMDACRADTSHLFKCTLNNGAEFTSLMNVTDSAHGLSSILTCAAASASGTAYTCSTSPTFTPADGDVILFQADVANTGSATLNVNASSAATIKKQGGGTNLVANDLLAGQDTLLEYDGTNWQMQGQTGNSAAGGVTSVSGDGVLITNSGSTGAVTLTLGKSPVGTDAGIATAATISTTAGTPVCATANGGVTTTACPVKNALTNTTAVTQSNPTINVDALLMDIPLGAGYLNTAGAPFLISGSGLLSSTIATTPQVTITAKLCSVSGCGSGTVTPLAAIQSSALNTTAITNATWIYDLKATTVGTGASCNLIVKGSLLIETGANVASADSSFADSNAAVSSPNQNCANALFLDFFVQQTVAGASNSYKQLSGIIGTLGGSGGSGGTTSQFAFWSPATGSISATQTVALNVTKIWGFASPLNITSSTGVCYYVTTADNSANLYDIGVYDTTGALIVHTGATAGTTLFPGTGMKCANWTASATVVAGRSYFAMTTGTTATAILGGFLTSAQFASNVTATGGTTSGGVLNGSITPPSDTWASGQMIDFNIH